LADGEAEIFARQETIRGRNVPANLAGARQFLPFVGNCCRSILPIPSPKITVDVIELP
jgi:hypothetical protein